MFRETEGSRLVEIKDEAFGFVYKCYVPKVGYGVNWRTGELQETDVFKRSEIPSEQYWERPMLPLDYKKLRNQEKATQKFDKSFVDPYVENIRRKEWRRMLCGVHFWNDGEIEYITGIHYMYLTFWKFQGKVMDFRIPNRNYFYVWRYIEEDPNALGLNEITKRKDGKTARLGAILYYRTMLTPNVHAGLQSKADDDAEEVFKKAIIYPWQKLPDFIRPIYDTNKGDNPSELMFFHPSRRGSSADEENEDEALNSWIDFKSATESAYDGPELHTYGSDESGKTKKPVSIQERQRVTRFCSEIDGVMTGKHLYTTTVELDEDDEDNYEFQDLTAKSNPLDRDDNGRTGTGLYTLFLPAQNAMYFDKHGHPDIEKATIYLMNTRRKLEQDGDMRGLSSFKRKNPMNFREAFSADGKTALYNPELINTQLDDIMWRTDITERGDLQWEGGNEFVKEMETKDGIKYFVPSKIIWVSNPYGRFEKVKDWWPKDANKVVEINGRFVPNNNFAMRIGCDPFKYDSVKSKRRSMCAAFAYQMFDELDKENEYGDMFTMRYCFRRDSTRQANEDILKMAWLCGCQVLFERNVNHWKDHFSSWKCDKFLMWLPGELEPGIYTDGQTNGNSKVIQLICNYTESYINEHINKVLWKSLMRKETGWLGFKPEDTQAFDEPMAAGFTLIAVRGKKYSRPVDHHRDIESVLPLYKAS